MKKSCFKEVSHASFRKILNLNHKKIFTISVIVSFKKKCISVLNIETHILHWTFGKPTSITSA